ncbi:MAG TPA: hypothetical protein VGI33_19945 [Paenibacillus sp.]
MKVSMEYLRYKNQARGILRSKEGHSLSVRRLTESESVFGQIKNNRGSGVFCYEACKKLALRSDGFRSPIIY